jgi:acetylglutamate kinase
VAVKYGGAVMKDESLKERVIKDMVLLSCGVEACVGSWR